MKAHVLTFLITLFLITASSCDDDSIVRSGRGIYMGGGIGKDAGYWEDGAYTALTTGNAGAVVTAIFVQGKNVYTAGSHGDFLVMWKNKAMTKLTTGGTANFAARDITVFDKDIYVAGYEMNSEGNRVAKYWKNGKEIILGNSTTDSELYAIVVNNGDVYACGYETVAGFSIATQWKNGEATNLTNGKSQALAASIFVRGNDVYVAGYERAATGSRLPAATYWKNGDAVHLNDGQISYQLSDITMLGSDVLTVGYAYTSTLVASNAIYYTNSTLTFLTDHLERGYAGAKKIQISDNDVFIYGYDGKHALLWKNNVLVAPFDGSFADTNLVNDMFIVGK